MKKEFTFYFSVFDKKMKVTVEAESLDEAGRLFAEKLARNTEIAMVKERVEIDADDLKNHPGREGIPPEVLEAMDIAMETVNFAVAMNRRVNELKKKKEAASRTK